MSKNSNISSTPAGKNSGGGDLDLSHPDRAIALALIESGFSFSRSTPDLSEEDSDSILHQKLGGWKLGYGIGVYGESSIDAWCCNALFTKPVQPTEAESEMAAALKMIRSRLAEKYFSPGALVSFAIASVLPSLTAKIREVE